MRMMVVLSLLLLAGCAGSTHSFFPPDRDLPSGWRYTEVAHETTNDWDDDFPPADKTAMAELAGPSGTAQIIVLRYEDPAVARQAEISAIRYGCDDDDMTHLLSDEHHLVLIGTWDADRATSEALEDMRDTIASTTKARTIC